MKHDNQIAGGVRMDNTVFERNYEKPQEDMEYCTAVFEQAVEGGFFQRYCDMVDKIPKETLNKSSAAG